jgi:hypothetical protein
MADQSETIQTELLDYSSMSEEELKLALIQLQCKHTELLIKRAERKELRRQEKLANPPAAASKSRSKKRNTVSGGRSHSEGTKRHVTAIKLENDFKPDPSLGYSLQQLRTWSRPAAQYYIDANNIHVPQRQSLFALQEKIFAWCAENQLPAAPEAPPVLLDDEPSEASSSSSSEPAAEPVEEEKPKEKATKAPVTNAKQTPAPKGKAAAKGKGKNITVHFDEPAPIEPEPEPEVPPPKVVAETPAQKIARIRAERKAATQAAEAAKLKPAPAAELKPAPAAEKPLPKKGGALPLPNLGNTTRKDVAQRRESVVQQFKEIAKEVADTPKKSKKTVADSDDDHNSDDAYDNVDSASD